MSDGGTGRLRQLIGKAGWNLFDQALSSLTNIVLTLLVARQSSDVGFGAFSTASLLFSLLIAVERAGVGQVLSIRHSEETDEGMRDVAARAFGTVLALVAPLGLLIAVVGVAYGEALRGPLLAIGLLMAPLLLQDTARMVFFAQSKPELAALNDTVWAVVQFTATGVLFVTGTASTTSLIVVWASSAGVAALLAMVRLHAFPLLSAAVPWARRHRALLGYLLPETLLTSGGDKVAYFAVTGMIGLAGLGAVNGARQVLNPLLIITSAAVTFMIPEISRRDTLTPRVRRLIGLALGVAMAVATLAYVGLVLLLPSSVGRWAMGDTWAGIETVLLPMGVFSAASAACAGPFIVIAGMGHAKRTFRLTVLQTILLPLMPAGAFFDGARGAAWGLALNAMILLPFWVVSLSQVANEGPIPEEEPDVLPADGGLPATSGARKGAEHPMAEAVDPLGTIPIPLGFGRPIPRARPDDPTGRG